jgi:hypothetical protein
MTNKFINALKYLINTKKRKVLRRWFRRKVSKLLRKLIRATRKFLEDINFSDGTKHERLSRYFDQRYRKNQACRDRFKGDVKPKLKDKSKLDDKPTIEDKDKELKDKK